MLDTAAQPTIRLACRNHLCRADRARRDDRCPGHPRPCRPRADATAFAALLADPPRLQARPTGAIDLQGLVARCDMIPPPGPGLAADLPDLARDPGVPA